MMSPLSKKIVRLRAELIAGDERYDGIIESFARDSIHFLMIGRSQADLSPESPLKIRFQTSQGDEMTLHCTLKWSYKTPPHGLTNTIGMKIVNVLPKYEHFYRTLR